MAGADGAQLADQRQPQWEKGTGERAGGLSNGRTEKTAFQVTTGSRADLFKRILPWKMSLWFVLGLMIRDHQIPDRATMGRVSALLGSVPGSVRVVLCA